MGRPHGGSMTKKFIKNSLPAMPRRGPEAEIHRIDDNFHGSAVNRNDPCLFLGGVIFHL